MVLPLLIREIEKRGRALGFTPSEVAASLGVDRTRLSHIRNGSGRLSLTSLHEIANRFGDDPTIRDLVLGYLALDIEGAGVSRRQDNQAVTRLDAGAQLTAHALMRQLPELLVAGGGILVEDTNLSRLAGVLTAFEEAARRRGVGVLRERASASLSVDRRKVLLAVPLLIVDSVSVLRRSVAEVLMRRADAARFTLGAWRPRPGETPLAPLDTFRRLRLRPLTPAPVAC